MNPYAIGPSGSALTPQITHPGLELAQRPGPSVAPGSEVPANLSTKVPVAVPVEVPAGANTPKGRFPQASSKPPQSNKPFAQEPSKTIYLPKTNNWVGKSLPERREMVMQALLAAGPQGKLEVEILGSNGDYLSEISPVLREALASLPPTQRPQLSGFVSGLQPNSTAPLAQLAMAPGEGTGVLGKVKDGQLILNLGHPKIFKAVQDQISAYLSFAKSVGMRPNVSLDDHFAVPNDPQVQSAFLSANHLKTSEQGRAFITNEITQLVQQVNRAGGDFTLSSVGTLRDAKETWVDMAQVAQNFPADRNNEMEFQVYRNTPQEFQNTLNTLRKEINSNAGALKNVAKFRIAVTTSPNKTPLSNQDMTAQLNSLHAFGKQIAADAKAHGLPANRWQVQASLWTYSAFYPPQGAGGVAP
jgi:hypothetical protein